MNGKGSQVVEEQLDQQFLAPLESVEEDEKRPCNNHVRVATVATLLVNRLVQLIERKM